MSWLSCAVRRRLRGGLIALLATLCAISAGSAQDELVLVRMLREGQSFKVRARAAIALGHSEPALARPALERALSDRSRQVRVAAARALGELGDARALPALRALLRGQPPAVKQAARAAIAALTTRAPTALAALQPLPSAHGPGRAPIAWQRIRYAVVVGEMRNQSREADAALAPLLGQRVAEQLARVRRLAVFSAEQLTDEVAGELARRKLARFRVEGTLNDVRRGAASGQLSVRCEVSLLLLDEPDRNLRSVLKGAATGVEPPTANSAGAQARRLTHRALDGAVKSALTDAWAALEGAAGRSQRPASRRL